MYSVPQGLLCVLVLLSLKPPHHIQVAVRKVRQCHIQLSSNISMMEQMFLDCHILSQTCLVFLEGSFLLKYHISELAVEQKNVNKVKKKRVQAKPLKP